ncbi:MAG: thioredoxin family protein [Alphaproteobacteria bacterium]|nr:thioredoxin family protein [Alphaproteobacteria bacterium]
MRNLAVLLALIVALTSARLAGAADSAKTPRVEATLVSQVQGVPAQGGTVALALHLRIAPHWHTYWRNPGDSGEATQIAWTLPQGFGAGEIVWPHPQRLPFGQLANYGYSDEVLLRVDIAVPAGLKPGDSVTFKGAMSWLVCKDICIPEQATLDLALPVVDGAPAVNETWRQAFEDAARLVPVKSNSFDAKFAANDAEVTLYFFPTLNRIERGVGAQFFPYEKGLIKSSTAQVSQPRDGGFAFTLPPGWKLRDAEKRKTIDRIEGVLVLAPLAGNSSQSFEVALHRGPVPAAPMLPANDLPLAQAILFAVLGGLILNLMPCVFPILSMKALALVKAGHAERPWMDGLAYLFGVVTTFTGLAVALLAFRAAGEDAGWGFQLQSPLVVAALAYVLVAVGLNLSGVFQVAGSVQGAGQSLANQPGVIGSFFTGILAVVVAAPCTAPFMGAAMSFAFTQGPVITIVIFIALGFGLALPWVVFSFSPPLIRLLPKPGAWMERFKQFLAFPMYAAAAWLVWVLSQQVTPEGLFRVLIGTVMLGLGAWALGMAQERKAMGHSRLGSLFLLLLGAGASIALLLPPFAQRAATTGFVEAAKEGSIPSEPYTAVRLAELRAQGRPIFVNLTAAWCVSCLYNEQVALSSTLVADVFKSTGTAYLVGDWTNRNPEISALLKQYGREGVPLYLYFPAGGGEPQILPQLLNQGIMLETLGMTK